MRQRAEELDIVLSSSLFSIRIFGHQTSKEAP
jgi:hypothetical protein